MSVTRRRLLAWLGASAGALPVVANDRVSAYFEAISPHVGDSDKSVAVNWVRFINTAEAAFNHEFHRYASLDVVLTAKALRERNVTMQQLPAQFDSILSLSEDASDYLVMIRDRVSSFGYRSDRRGVILEGIAPPFSGIRSTDIERAFQGTPIVDPGKRPSRAQVAGRARTAPLMHAWAFFMPTLSAQGDNDCPMGTICGGCKNCCCCAEHCCNWGTTSCVWCCSPTGLCC